MDLKEYEAIIENVMKQLCENSRFPQTAEFRQHGSVSIYEHSIDVARMSCWLAYKLRINVDYASLIRGALLHDYFLYDWHDRSKEHRLHAFSHPRKALQNACEDFKLTPKEKNIILRHMFPLTPIPPCYLESWIVCVTDTFCALKETLRMNDIHLKKGRGAYQYDFR